MKRTYLMFKISRWIENPKGRVCSLCANFEWACKCHGVETKIYFAHPVSDYGKERETFCLKLIQGNSEDCLILNPNQKEHNEAYKTQGMTYFEQLALSCHIVAVPFEDGEWGMGVWREAESVARKGGRIFELNPELKTVKEIDYKDIRPLSINETRRRVNSKKND